MTDEVPAHSSTPAPDTRLLGSEDTSQNSRVADLINLIKDDDPEVRAMAVNALGRIGGEEARLAIRQCLQSEDAVLREAAEAAQEEIEAIQNPIGPGL